jgi:hypothetical protein
MDNSGLVLIEYVDNEDHDGITYYKINIVFIHSTYTYKVRHSEMSEFKKKLLDTAHLAAVARQSDQSTATKKKIQLIESKLFPGDQYVEPGDEKNERGRQFAQYLSTIASPGGIPIDTIRKILGQVLSSSAPPTTHLERIIEKRRQQPLNIGQTLAAMSMSDTNPQRGALRDAQRDALDLTVFHSAVGRAQHSQHQQAVVRPELAKVIFEYEAEDETNITIAVGDVVVVSDKPNADWWWGHVEGKPDKFGFFPASFVEMQGGGPHPYRGSRWELRACLPKKI